MSLYKDMVVAYYKPSEQYKNTDMHVCISDEKTMTPLAMTGFANPKTESEVNSYLESIAHSVYMIIAIEKSRLIKIAKVNENDECVIAPIPFSEFERIEKRRNELLEQSVRNGFAAPIDNDEELTIKQLIKKADSLYDEIAMGVR